jgi:hypothetical protein
VNTIEASQLADKICHTWPKGLIEMDTWCEALEELMPAPADAALRNLRNTSDTMPSIAAFRAAYKSLIGTAHTPRIECQTCGGDGWQSCSFEALGRTYDGVKPCRCRAGDDNRDVHRRIIEENDKQLRALGRTPPPAAAMRPPDWSTLRPNPQGA